MAAWDILKCSGPSFPTGFSTSRTCRLTLSLLVLSLLALSLMAYPPACLEKIQILHAAAPGDDSVFDRQEQTAGDVDLPVARGGKCAAEPDGVLDAGCDVKLYLRIGLARRGGDIFGIRALVMRAGADDGVEGRRQCAHDLAGFLVAGNAGHENPVLSAVNRLQACERLPDAVRGVADVDHRQRVLRDNLKTAWPARVAQADSHGRLDSARGLCGPRTLQPQQEQGEADVGVVELKRALQVHFEATKFVSSEREIEPLSCRRKGFAAD